jgi:hypothetical protein
MTASRTRKSFPSWTTAHLSQAPFVANIFDASEADYRKAVQRVYRTPESASAIVLPVVTE